MGEAAEELRLDAAGPAWGKVESNTKYKNYKVHCMNIALVFKSRNTQILTKGIRSEASNISHLAYLLSDILTNLARTDIIDLWL